jgi:hypothetical protein
MSVVERAEEKENEEKADSNLKLDGSLRTEEVKVLIEGPMKKHYYVTDQYLCIEKKCYKLHAILKTKIQEYNKILQKYLEHEKHFYILSLPKSQIEEVLDFIVDFPQNYEIHDAYITYCFKHNVQIEWDADEMYCPADQTMESCRIGEKLLFKSQQFDPAQVITKTHPIVQNLLKQKELEERLEERKEETLIQYYKNIINKFKANYSIVQNYIVNRILSASNYKTIQVLEMQAYPKKLIINIYVINAIRVFEITWIDSIFDVIDTFCFVKKEDYLQLNNQLQEVEERRKKEEEERKRKEEMNKKLLTQKAEEITKKFWEINNKIKIEYEIHSDHAYVITKIEGFIPKDQFNKYLSLNRQLGGKYDPKNQKWKIKINL